MNTVVEQGIWPPHQILIWIGTWDRKRGKKNTTKTKTKLDQNGSSPIWSCVFFMLAITSVGSKLLYGKFSVLLTRLGWSRGFGPRAVCQCVCIDQEWQAGQVELRRLDMGAVWAGRWAMFGIFCLVDCGGRETVGSIGPCWCKRIRQDCGYTVCVTVRWTRGAVSEAVIYTHIHTFASQRGFFFSLGAW